METEKLKEMIDKMSEKGVSILAMIAGIIQQVATK